MKPQEEEQRPPRPPVNPKVRYESPRRSRLEQHGDLIREMRANGWPLECIREYLRDGHQVRVSGAAIGKFCRSRKILKGGRPPAEAAQAAPPFPVGVPASRPPSALPPSPQPEAGPPGKSLTGEELDALKAKAAREAAEAAAANAARKAKWNFAATEAEIFRATTPGYENT